MEFQIFAICFDVGGTLRIAQNDPEKKMLRAQELHQALGWIGPVEDLISTIEQRHLVYENWYTKTLCDISEEKLWSTYLLPDYPLEFVNKNAKKFNELWRDGRNKKCCLMQMQQSANYHTGAINWRSSATPLHQSRHLKYLMIWESLTCLHVYYFLPPLGGENPILPCF
jgi:hypothetical protein